ncbi:MAG: cell division protein FtsA, partial [Candidatus Bipolaricaulia bacterium]
MGKIAVADVGTFSTKVVIGESNEGLIDLTGIGKSSSEGVSDGRIVKSDQVAKSLREATDRAEEMASEEIHSVYIGVGGNLLSFSMNDATITISSGDRIVKQKDVTRIKDLVSSIDTGVHNKIVSTIPQRFTLDGQEGIINPIGLQGRRLEVEATLFLVNEKCIRNYNKVATRAGLTVEKLVPTPFCTGELLLTEEEKNRGKALIDFGMDTTKLITFKEGQFSDCITLSLGGKNLTGDLSAKLNAPSTEARGIKHDFKLEEPGGQTNQLDQTSNPFQKYNRGDREEIYTTLTARIEEIFELILSRARNRGHDKLLEYGIKITGGSAKLPGLVEVLNDKFEPNFELGNPTRPIRGIKDVIEDPSYGPV